MMVETEVKEIKVESKEVTFRIRRYDPETGKRWWAEYKVPVIRGMTVLDALLYIKENIDHTLTARYSCRMGVCGSCGMIINGTPMLACSIQVLDLGTDVVTVEPLPNLPTLRDLSADFTRFFEKHKLIKPFIIRVNKEEYESPQREYRMFPEELNAIIQFAYCLKCGLCYAACPTSAIDKLYLGPQALAQAYRWISDVRDEGMIERIEVVDSAHGCWRCHFAGSCSAVCPKGVDPAQGIQLLRALALSLRTGRSKVKKGSPIVQPSPATRRPGAVEPPKPTVNIEVVKENLKKLIESIEEELPSIASALKEYMESL